MKLPKIRELPSGSYHCRLRIGGRDISITRWSEREVMDEIHRLKSIYRENGPVDKGRITLRDAIDKYIEARPGLREDTVVGYRNIQKNHFQDVMDRSIFGSVKWQEAVASEAAKYSPKTVHNSWGLISSVLSENRVDPGKIRLPAVEQPVLDFLTAEELPAFLEIIRGDVVELPALFALHSLRRSEIGALKRSNIRKGVIYVEGALIYGEGNKPILSEKNKTPKSRRAIRIMIPRLMEILPKEDPIIKVTMPYVTQRLEQLCEENGFPRIGLHDLRRTYASLAYHLGIGEMETMVTGGWTNIQTVRKIYTRLSELDLLKSQSKMADFYEQIGNKSATEL